ncbi:hypothetical protein H9P43_001406 [Blastocladiella emersonii ATCC 22665]|nr:hypothetical protein H9P43_001406 [Blastocladiella emersonii ATCC 22665]
MPRNKRTASRDAAAAKPLLQQDDAPPAYTNAGSPAGAAAANYATFPGSSSSSPTPAPAAQTIVTHVVAPADERVHHVIVVHTGAAVPEERARQLYAKSPCSDCTRAAVCPLVTFVLVVLGLATTMLVYPRLLAVNVHDVGLDFAKVPPIKFGLAPPSVTLHLLSNVSIWNPLLTDLHNVSLNVVAKYPHFDPPVVIGRSTLDQLLELPSRQQASALIPFDVKLPDASLPSASSGDDEHQISLLSRITGLVSSTAEPPRAAAPGLLDVVLALVDDCKSRNAIALDLEIRTSAATWWWKFGGSVNVARNVLVACHAANDTGTPVYVVA